MIETIEFRIPDMVVALDGPRASAGFDAIHRAATALGLRVDCWYDPMTIETVVAVSGERRVLARLSEDQQRVLTGPGSLSVS